MKLQRSAGIVLHPTSFPGPDGIGDIGPEAYRWVNFLSECGCSLWQLLPLGPTGYGDSPYQCFSAFAGNPYLISSTSLLSQGLLTREDLIDRPDLSTTTVDYGPTIQWKLILLDRAYRNFLKTNDTKLAMDFEAFCSAQFNWLDDFALFMALKESQEGNAWGNWPAPLRDRDPGALEKFRNKNSQVIERQKFRQFIFFQQWSSLRQYARSKGVVIIGDAPIFVAYDSADAWSNRDLFFLDDEGKPTVVAGVPPDYFSPTGQLWGNPLYNWKKHHETNFAWWVKRIRATLQLFDIIRLDHFRGFAGYWEVPFGEPTAENGRWVPGPGAELFEAIRAELGDLPIIAEDLGEITPDVIHLRDSLDLPGMKIFQFAFANDAEDPFLPHNYTSNCVAYTGTHDNDTSMGWYRTAPEVERDFIRRYLGRSGDDISWDMIRAVWSSVANFALAPLQDFLQLDSDARMNFPGQASGNWGWRFNAGAIHSGLTARIHEINTLYNRLQAEQKPRKEKAQTPNYFL
jgi:4-alpha-glucanotransferase